MWDSGFEALAYTVLLGESAGLILRSVAPDVEGRADVGPGDLANGIALTFSSDVAVASIALAAGGMELPWVPTSAGRTLTLHANPAKPAFCGTECAVVGFVADASGNQTAIHIEFTTRAAE